MADFFDIFFEWFGQGLSFPIVIVDIAFFLIGLRLTLHNPQGKRIILGTAIILLLSLFGGQAHGYLIAILSVICCGVSTMFFVGAIIGWIITQIVKSKNSQK